MPHAQHCTFAALPSLPNTALHLRPLIAQHSTALSPPSLPNTGLRFRPPLLPHRALHLEWDAQQRRGAGAGQDLAVRALRPHELSEMMLGHLFVAQDGHRLRDRHSVCDALSSKTVTPAVTVGHRSYDEEAGDRLRDRLCADMRVAAVLLLLLWLQGTWQELSTQYRGILLPGVQLPGGALQAVRAGTSV